MTSSNNPPIDSVRHAVEPGSFVQVAMPLNRAFHAVGIPLSTGKPSAPLATSFTSGYIWLTKDVYAFPFAVSSWISNGLNVAFHADIKAGVGFIVVVVAGGRVVVVAGGRDVVVELDRVGAVVVGVGVPTPEDAGLLVVVVEDSPVPLPTPLALMPGHPPLAPSFTNWPPMAPSISFTSVLELELAPSSSSK